MSQLLDPRTCPDCRATLDAAGTCTGCNLRLTGPLATELWSTMQTADSLIERLRLQAAPSSATTRPPLSAGLPIAPPVPVRAPASRLSAGSVPTVLFGVGALCLLVAAVVFVAVAWSSLGLGARTTILLGVTGTFAALASRLTVRGLRGAAETFWLVVGALVTIDVTAAYVAGLVGFDTLDGRHAAAVLGGVLLSTGVGVGTWARRTAVADLFSSTALSTVGALLLVGSEAWAASNAAVGSVVAIFALTALAVGTRQLGLRTTAYAVSGLVLITWTGLVLIGVSRAADATPSSWWGGLDGWPLLAAALIAAAVAARTAFPEILRTLAAAAAELTLALLIIGPGAGASTEIVVVAVIACTLAGLSVTGPRIWALPAAGYAAAAGVVAAGYTLVRPIAALSGLPTTGPADSANLHLRIPAVTDGPASWTAIVVAAVVVLVGLALTRWITDPALRQSAERSWLFGAPSVAAVGVVTMFLESTPTLFAAVLAWTAVLAILAAAATLVRGVPAIAVLAGTGYLGIVGLRLAVGSHLLAALLATALAVGLAIGYRRTSAHLVTRALTGAAALVAAGFAATHWPYLLGGQGDAAGITLAVVAAVAGVLAARVTREQADRPILEITALALGLGAVAFPVDDGVITLVLTLVGSAVALVSVLHRDRDEIAWLGTGILGLAALLRVSNDLSLPELATAPAAALLLIAGVHRMRTDETCGSLRVLGSGLTLALLPTLLLSIDEPVSVRAAALGAAALIALTIGINQRWAAPFLAGSAVLAVLALRHLGPVAEGLPRWISLGTVGALLLAVAVTWESRRRQLEVAERYLAALR